MRPYWSPFTVVLMIVTAACGSSSADPTTTVAPATSVDATTTAPPTTTTTSTTTTPQTTAASVATTTASVDLTQTVEGALGVKDRFLAAYNDGTADDVVSLFSTEGRVVSFMGRTCSFPGSGCADLEQFRTMVAWDIAQDVEWTAANCSTQQWTKVVAGEVTLQDAIQVICDVTYHQLLYRAVGSKIHGTVQFIVAEDLLIEVGDNSDWLQFQEVEVPFIEWVSQVHPDDLDRMIGANWRDPLFTLESAELRNAHAEEYSAALDG